MRIEKLIVNNLINFLSENNNENNHLDYDYVFDKEKLNDFILNARKWKQNDFIEEYVYLNDINLIKDYGRINKGDKIIIGRIVKDNNGK